MIEAAHARRYVRRDGTSVRALQYDGRVAGFGALLTAFPGCVLPHPHRDDAVLIAMASGRHVRITAGDWLVELADGSLEIDPDDQFNIRHELKAIAA